MGLTETKNKQLALAIMVDPSLISRLRSGKRNLPSNAEYITSIAEYFSTRLTTDFQMKALARAIGKSYIDFSDKEKTTQIIESWLISDALTSQSYGNLLLQSFDKVALSISQEISSEISLSLTSLKEHNQTVYAFYGNEGKKQALSLFCKMILTAKTASEVKMVTGNSTEWLWKDRKYSEQVSGYLKNIFLQGYSITRIVPRNQNITMSLDTVDRWLPFYVTGRVHSFYYPYHRDRIFNRMLYVAPDIAALVSTSVGNKTECGLTILTTNPDMITSLESEFNDYLELCMPATSFYDYEKSYEELYQCISSFYAYQADCINILGGLSYITTPKEVLLDFAQSSDNLSIDTLNQHFDSEYAEIVRLLQRYRYTEIFSIDSFEDIISGNAKSCAINGEIFFYTPNAYIRHLKNIISMLENYDNYHVVLVKDRKIESTIYVKKGYSVLAFLYKSPYSVCEIKILDMVAAVWDYANNEMDTGIPDDIYKLQVITSINKLILQLDNYA